MKVRPIYVREYLLILDLISVKSTERKKQK